MLALTACDRAKHHDAPSSAVASASASAVVVASSSAVASSSVVASSSAVASDAGPCEESVVQVGQCLPPMKPWTKKEVIAWFAKHGVSDAASVAMLEREESVTCEEHTLGARRELALVCVRIDPHFVLPEESFSSPSMADLVLDVLAVRGGKAVRALAVPVGLDSSAWRTVFLAPWTIDDAGMAVELAPREEDCRAAPERLAKFWATAFDSKEPFVKRASEAERRLDVARVAAICRGPKHVAIK